MIAAHRQYGDADVLRELPVLPEFPLAVVRLLLLYAVLAVAAPAGKDLDSPTPAASDR